jgi:hypothetical protein
MSKFSNFLIFVFLLIRKGPKMSLYEIHVDLHDPWRVYTSFNLVYDIKLIEKERGEGKVTFYSNDWVYMVCI